MEATVVHPVVHPAALTEDASNSIFFLNHKKCDWFVNIPLSNSIDPASELKREH